MRNRFALVFAVAAMLGISGRAFAGDPPAGNTPPEPQAKSAPAAQAMPATQADPATPANHADPATPATQAVPATPPDQAVPDKGTPMIQTMALTGPPAEIKKLAMFQGTWTGKSHMYASPMGPESNSSSKATYKWTFANMHLEGDHQFTMMGKPAFGRTTWGWDPDKKQYQVVWTDGMAPSSMMYYGTFSTDNTLVLFTTYTMQAKPVTEKITYTFSTPDSYTMVIENDMAGTMQKVMEETATKGKAGATASKGSKKTVASTSSKKSG